MATSYTSSNFTPDVVPVVFKKDVAQLIAQAVAVGWQFMVKADNTATLIAPAPHQHQTIHLSARRNSGPLRRLGAKVMKYADPALLEEATEPKVLIDPTPADAPENTTPVEEIDAPVAKARILMSEGPMLSKSSGQNYTSNIAIQREWSDGTITYACTRCDYEGTKPVGMGSHWKKHVHEDERNRGNHIGVFLPGEKRDGYEPTEARLSSLTDALVTAMESGLDWTDLHEAARQLAKAALVWDHQRGGVGEPREPLSDTDLLNKIRALVDNGLYEQQRAEIVRLTVRVEAEAAEAEKARSEADEVRSTLATFRDLFNEAAS